MTGAAVPLYLVADVSFSTTDRVDGTTGIEQTNSLVASLVDRLAGTPELAARVWLSVIDFADEATVPVPLSPVTRLVGVALPTLVARGGTSYACALTKARDCIEHDLAQIRADGVEPGSPLVVFLTDGDPLEPDRVWQDAFAALVSLDAGRAPRIWPVGYGAANPVLLDRLVSPPGWAITHVFGVADPASQVAEMVLALLDEPDAAPVRTGGADDGPFAPADPDEIAWHEWGADASASKQQRSER